MVIRSRSSIAVSAAPSARLAPSSIDSSSAFSPSYSSSSSYSPSSSFSSMSPFSCVRRRREITPQEKSAYMKAFIVWVCFTAGGWLSIPNEYLPLFSHCVGFGFFLVMVTKQTRWLLALSIGALVFSSLTHNLLPRSWIAITSNSLGYAAFIVFLLLVLCCVRVRNKPPKAEDNNLSLDSMSLTLSRAALHAMNAMTDTYTAIPNTNEIFEEMRKSMFNLQMLMDRAKEQSYSTYKDMQTFMISIGSKFNETQRKSSAAASSVVESDAENENEEEEAASVDSVNAHPAKAKKKAKNKKKVKLRKSDSNEDNYEQKSNDEHEQLQSQKRRRRKSKNKKSSQVHEMEVDGEQRHAHNSQSDENESEHEEKEKSSSDSSKPSSDYLNCSHCTAKSYLGLPRDELLSVIHSLHEKLTSAEKEIQWLMNELATKSAVLAAHANESEEKYDSEEKAPHSPAEKIQIHAPEPTRCSPNALVSASSAAALASRNSPPQGCLTSASSSPRLTAASSLEVHRRVVDSELERLTRELKEMMAIQTKMQQHMRQLDPSAILHSHMQQQYQQQQQFTNSTPTPTPIATSPPISTSVHPSPQRIFTGTAPSYSPYTSTSSSSASSVSSSSSSVHSSQKEGHITCACSEGSQHRFDCPTLSDGRSSHGVLASSSTYQSTSSSLHALASSYSVFHSAAVTGPSYSSASAAQAHTASSRSSSNVCTVRPPSSSQAGEEGGEPGMQRNTHNTTNSHSTAP